MTVPNLIGIFLLTPVLLRLIKEHFAKNQDLRK
jgi:Na+/alanine symporter